MGYIEIAMTVAALAGMVAIAVAALREQRKRRKLTEIRWPQQPPRESPPSPTPVSRAAMPPARPGPPPAVRGFGAFPAPSEQDFKDTVPR